MQPSQIFGGAKYFDIKRGTVFGLIQHFSKHKMKRYCMLEACKETMSPLATPMSRTLSSDSSKAWSNLTSLELLIRA